MKGKVAVITGAKGGLGSFVTQRFLDAGATVIGVSRSIKPEDFRSGSFIALPGELSSSAAATTVIDAAVQEAGRIDTLVHLLGGFAGGKPLQETDDATLEQMLDLNFRSAFYTFRAALQHMQKACTGSIVAVGSRAAVESPAGLSAYSASKAALISLVKTIAVENSKFGITANIVLPGTIDTPANRAASTDATKLVDPARVAETIFYLASPAGAQITGAAIPIYGRDV